jgi:hypothetical protein
MTAHVACRNAQRSLQSEDAQKDRGNANQCECAHRVNVILHSSRYA